jgi:phosphoglycerate dehydrogenase-like enzyme
VPVLYVDREPPAGVREAVAARATLAGPDPAALAGAVGIVAGTTRWDGPRLEGAPAVRVLSRTGVGFDNIDLEAATARGVAVCIAADAPTVATAEHTITLLLALARRLPVIQARQRAGTTEPYGVAATLELAGRTLGLFGFGRIGRRVARVASALDMRVITHDPFVAAGDCAAAGVESVGFDELLDRADVLSLHAPATPETRQRFDASVFARARRGVLLVNCARGELVDHTALLAALDAGQVGGAALDVTEPEPLPLDHPLLARDDVIVTPHVAAMTDRGRMRLYTDAIDNALAVLRGEPAPIVNAAALLEARS